MDEELTDQEDAAESGLEADGAEPVVARMPARVQEAIHAGDSAALQRALAALPDAEAQAMVARLERAGVIRRESGPELAEVLAKFEPLLRAVAYVAMADASEAEKARVEAALGEVEALGWQLAEPARRVWAGARDEATVTAGIDANSARLARRLLALVK